ncbi:tRNA (cytosine(38)-C(5))-methyltransferase isoform X1 [Xiphophorus couchianus]|uniref:tRNA (cytosine(38)-C(5))-methyltransferase isoform X1 n=2 Tax=Xiphophorus couchianus TaxID=32473 RepID=UPI001016D9CE|nr:tRNA (cytosine(38)-C(5))-methyltransferase isoform X1 [Xiphophorus couchianus]
MESLRVLELYSGIGGMHYALKESGISAQVVAAVDINTTANKIYRHNFPDTPLWNKTIEGIPLDDFNKLSFDMIMMSPPCQPFTRLGLQGDIADPRCKSFLFILELLPRLCKMPTYILLENVKGFESSSARDYLIKTLSDCGYTYQESMISPTSVGVPNSRLRYFLVAKMSAENSSIQTSAKGEAGGVTQWSSVSSPSEMMSSNYHSNGCSFSHVTDSEFPERSSVLRSKCQNTDQPSEDNPNVHVLYKRETQMDSQKKTNQNKNLSVQQIQGYLEPQMNIDMELYLLKPKTLLRYGSILDIVQPHSRRSVCFTKGYGRYVEGTGSVLQCCMENEISSVFTNLDQLTEEEKLQKMLKLNLRYFTPREVANVMGFPQSFTFPEDISIIQQYRVLGNSLNVLVVARLLQLMTSEHFGHSEGEEQFSVLENEYPCS